MAKKRIELSFVEKIKKITRSGISNSPMPNRIITEADIFPTLEERIEYVLNIVNNDKRPASNMLFFVMYDIESNKVRNQVVKYLLKNGCTRVQKSVFLADISNNVYDKIRQDLAAVQACYENNDSILVVPISTDYLNAMKIIGKNVEIDVITKKKSILFF